MEKMKSDYYDHKNNLGSAVDRPKEAGFRKAIIIGPLDL